MAQPGGLTLGLALRLVPTLVQQVTRFRRAVRVRHQGFLFAMRSLILAAAGMSSGWRVISDVKRVDKESSRSSSYHLCAGRQRTKLCDEIQRICHVLVRQ